MKLAQALLMRSELQNKISELEIRLSNNAIVQEGEEPAEDPAQLLSELNDALIELEKLIGDINLANARITRDGVTMTQLLARRDCMKRRISALRELLDSAASTGKRARSSEIKLIATVPVKQLQADVDKQSAILRQLDMDIQALNWQSDMD